MKFRFLTFILLSITIAGIYSCSPKLNVKSDTDKLLENFWRMRVVKGQTIPVDTGIVKPYIDFNLSNFSTYLICNIVNGTYSLGERNKISFSIGNPVQRHCSSPEYRNFDIEVKSILNRVNSWKIENNELILLTNDEPQIYLTKVPR